MNTAAWMLALVITGMIEASATLSPLIPITLQVFTSTSIVFLLQGHHTESIPFKWSELPTFDPLESYSLWYYLHFANISAWGLPEFGVNNSLGVCGTEAHRAGAGRMIPACNRVPHITLPIIFRSEF
jgi:hypothetical protein